MTRTIAAAEILSAISRVSGHTYGEYEKDITGLRWQSSLLAGVVKTYQIAGKWQGVCCCCTTFGISDKISIPGPGLVRFGFQRVNPK